MTTYRELIYMCLDLIKGISDDFTYTEEHIMYLIDKYRATILKQRYGNDPKKYIPTANYSNIIIPISGNKSDIELPSIMNIGIPRVTLFEEDKDVYDLGDYYSISVEYVPRERFPFVGNNKFLKNIKYCTLDPMNRMLTKGFNEDVVLLLTAVLETPIIEEGKDKIDSLVPIEESLIPTLIQYIIKDLYPASQRPSDPQNNANDDISNLAQYLNSLLKSKYRDGTNTSDDE